MLTEAVLLIFSVNLGIRAELNLYVAVRIVEIMLIGYMAGRLNKVRQNKYIAAVILACSLFCSVSAILVRHVSVYSLLRKIMPTLIWIVLCGTYFMRYSQHKEAGLADVPDNKTE